jgi:hypothetical protein
VKRIRVHLIAHVLRRQVRADHGDDALEVLLERQRVITERGVLIPIQRVHRFAIRAERRRVFLRRIFGLRRTEQA